MDSVTATRTLNSTVPAAESAVGTPSRTSTEAATMTVTLRYFAAAAAAAGRHEEDLTLPAPLTVADALGEAARRHGPEFERVLERCSFLRNTVAVRDLSTSLDPGDAVDLLPPFAGG